MKVELLEARQRSKAEPQTTQIVGADVQFSKAALCAESTAEAVGEGFKITSGRNQSLQATQAAEADGEADQPATIG